MKILALALAAALVGAPAFAATSTVFSEDFSGSTPGTYGPGVIPGTQFSVSNNNVDIVGVLNGSFYSCAQNPSGNCVDLVGNSGTGSVVSSTPVDLVVGSKYDIKFDVVLQGYSMSELAQSDVTVSLGSFTGQFAATGAGDSYDLSFTNLLAGPSSLTFTTTSAPDGVHGAVVSNVSVLETTAGTVSAAPEPGAWALMLAGVGVAGLALRHRKKQAGVTLAA